MAQSQDKRKYSVSVRIPVRKDRTHFNQMLISAVENRPAIWDMADPDHKNAKKVMAFWKDIAIEMKVTVNLVMSRWRNLRDTYKKYLRQIAAAIKSGSNSNVCWVHFEQLQFINRSLALRETSGNMFLSNAGLQNVQSESDFIISSEISLHSAADESWDAKNYTSSFEIGAPEEAQSSSGDGPRFLEDASAENSMAPGLSSPPRPLTEPPMCTLSPSLMEKSMPAREYPPRKRRYTINAHKHAVENDGRLVESTDNLRLLDNHFQAIMQSSMDSADHFLLSLAPHVRETPPELLPSLKMNLMYIACKYSKGVIPTELLQLDV